MVGAGGPIHKGEPVHTPDTTTSPISSQDGGSGRVGGRGKEGSGIDRPGTTCFRDVLWLWPQPGSLRSSAQKVRWKSWKVEACGWGTLRTSHRHEDVQPRGRGRFPIPERCNDRRPAFTRGEEYPCCSPTWRVSQWPKSRCFRPPTQGATLPDPPSHQQGRSPTAGGTSPAGVMWGPWQT